MATNMFYPIDDYFKVMLVQQILNKDRFHDKVMVNEEKRAIKGFIEKLADPKKYKAHWITKTGDKYEYLTDKMPNIEEYEKGNAVEIKVAPFYAEYMVKVWGDDAVSLLRVLSVEGMVYLHRALNPLTITIMDMIHKHKALVFKLHKIKVEEKIAIDKIERNPIYQLGLGDKLRRKAHERMFAEAY